MRRGESSKSRASVRSTNQYAQQQQQLPPPEQPVFSMANSKNTIYSSKYNLRSE